MKRSDAVKLRTAIETAAVSLDDKVASTAAALFPRLRGDGALIPAGTRINWRGTVKRAAADLWDTAENDPDRAADLWEDIEYRDGYRIIPDVITAAGAFALGECGWRGDVLWRSAMAANVYTPEQYPAGWEMMQT
ncbi:MAG: hypothetical protein E7579_04265 [Ruminococcaceae bacterium]|nr:hypothetical protein [Oscillospiraceae bacterium]